MESTLQHKIITKPNLGKRFVAGLIDYGIIFLFTGIMMYFYGEPSEDGGISLKGWPAFTTTIFWFIMTVGLEQLNGATIGNQLQNLRPVPKAGPWAKLTFGQSFKRHILDPFDLWPFGILGVILIKNTVYNQRLGDLWAKTIVLDVNDSEQGFK